MANAAWLSFVFVKQVFVENRPPLPQIQARIAIYF
jgi:hypothetical protein